MPEKADTLELYRKHLFENPKKPLPQRTMERLLRIRAAFTHWIEFPMKSDREIRDFIISQGEVNKSMAYNDLDLTKMLMGNVKNASKEWHRYRVIAMLEEAYNMAKNNEEAVAIAVIADKYGKYTQLHIPDKDQIPYEDIIPQPFEPTLDPSSLGLESDPDIDKKMKKMKEKYAEEIDRNVQDVEYIEIPTDEESTDTEESLL
jgi:hypothetical protein